MKTEIEKLAYAMQESYKRSGGLGSAIQRVKAQHPDANNNILEAMWRAIDAYVDMEGSDSA